MTKLILVVSEDTVLSEREIFELDCLFPNDYIAVLSPGIADVPPMMRLSHFSTNGVDYSSLERLIDVMELSAVVLRPGAFEQFRKPLLSAIVSRSLPRFYQIQETTLVRYKFARPANGRVILIYPGVFAPTRNGSTQRAFSLLLGLLSAGHQVEVVIPFGKGSHHFKVFLKQFGIGVHLFRLDSAQHPLSFLRGLTKKALGLNYYLPFFARLRFAVSSDFRRIVNNLVREGDTIIATYAWMTPTFLKKRRNVTVITDTHDVNFVRDKTYYRSQNIVSRILEGLNKSLELQRLNKSDQVIAISEADRAIFLSENLSAPVTLLEPSFEWIEGVPHLETSHALNFGFIGSNMVANRLALDEITNHLWPQIVKARPGATLFIAGGICDYLKGRETIGINVIPLGFVTSLEGYFSKIDALVSPIMMQGGLNFKVFESLCCGVPVLVNKEAEHLRKLSPMVYSYQDRDSIANFLSFVDAFSVDPAKRTLLAEEFRTRQSERFRSSLWKILNTT